MAAFKALEIMLTSGMALSNHAALHRGEPQQWHFTAVGESGILVVRDPHDRLFELQIKQLSGPQ